MKPIFKWASETGITCCTIRYNNIDFKGYSTCHPDDEDMKNEFTGSAIAEYRAYIKVLKHIKKNEIKPQLKSLKQLYYTMQHSTKFNPNSYEAKMLFRQISLKETEIVQLNNSIKNMEDDLKDYIFKKDEFYKSIRKNRDKIE